MVNPFFKNTGPHNINFLLKTINLKNYNLPDDQITDIKDLNSSQKNEITFFHSKRYTDLAKKTKASYCITSKNFESFLPNNCKAINFRQGFITYCSNNKNFLSKLNY